MNKDLLDILSNSNKEIDNQKLMDYLSGKLSGKEKHDVETLMADNDFVNDAMEGLQNMQDKSRLNAYVEQLNKNLHRQLLKKKLQREKRRLKENPWIYWSIVLILSFCLIAYFVIRIYLHQHANR